MTSSMLVGLRAAEDRPMMREGVTMRRIGEEAVVWSEIRPEPFHLDPIATVMIDVIDGVATTSELIDDVQSALSIGHYDARAHVKRILTLFDAAGMLTSSVATEPSMLQDRPLLPDPDW